MSEIKATTKTEIYSVKTTNKEKGYLFHKYTNQEILQFKDTINKWKIFKSNIKITKIFHTI